MTFAARMSAYDCRLGRERLHRRDIKVRGRDDAGNAVRAALILLVRRAMHHQALRPEESNRGADAPGWP